MRERAAAWLLALAPLAAAEPLAAGSEGEPLELREGDVIALAGNALAERQQHDGRLEAALHTALPDLVLRVRNLGFSGDTVDVRQRTAGFGSPDEHLHRVGADVVIGFFGFVESFRGEEGLAPFREALREWVDHVREERYGGEPTRLALVSSLPLEELEDPLAIDPAERNGWLRRYDAVQREVARECGVPFVDLHARMPRHYARARESGGALTIDGVHLNSYGNLFLARELMAGVFGVGPETCGFGSGGVPHAEELRELVLEKNALWFDRYRATDGYNVYGGRSSLAYTPGAPGDGGGGDEEAVTNYEVLQRELEVLDALCANLDRRIHVAALADPRRIEEPVPVPPLLEVETNRAGPNPDGSHVFLGGEEAVERMTAAPGAEVNLFAGEERFPELANPVQMSFDPAGRLWVAAWPSYPHWRPGDAKRDKLVVLEDTDGDGRADRSSVFADDLHNPTGFEHWNGGVLVASAPDLLFLEDTDGDGVADRRERVLHGLSSADTHHAANSFVLGPGGALYFQEGTFHRSQVETPYGVVRNEGGCVWRFEPRTFRVDRYVPYGFLNPHGHVFDRWGQDFVTDGTGNVNYYALPMSGWLPAPERHPATAPFFRQRSRPAAATEFLSGRHVPEESRGSYLVANVIGFQGVFQYRVHDDDAGFGAVETDPIVHSSDPNFRPVDLEVGPDGALYLLDWHNPLIGHMQHHLRDPSRDTRHGRVYRVSWPDRPLVEPVPIEGREVSELVALLAAPEDRVRYRARIELSARDAGEVVAAARAWAAEVEGTDAEAEQLRLEALWLQQQHGVLDEALLARLLRSPEPRARAAAVRALRWMRREHPAPLEALRPLAEDPHPRVRLEVVVAASHLSSAEAAELALRAARPAEDRFLEYALEETLRALEPAWRAALVSGEPFLAEEPGLLASLVARLDTADLLRARPHPVVQRELLARHDLDLAGRLAAARALGAERGTHPGAELLAAARRADGSTGGHTDHLLAGLFEAWGALPEAERGESETLHALAREGRRLATRRLATAARVEADGSLEPAWSEARRSPEALAAFLDAAVRIDDPALADALLPRAVTLFEAPVEGDAVRGRRVRVELPGERRTLTLAEVEVLSGGENVARSGTAAQSSESWGGAPERAIDGITSGAWGDGGQTHTTEDLPDPWWELDLGAERPIEAVRLWNRTDGDFARRLDGFVLRVLDADGRTVFRHEAESAPERSVTVDVASPARRVRAAAARLLGALGEERPEALEALASRFGDPDVRADAVAGLAAVPAERWPGPLAEQMARGLFAVLEEARPEALEDPAGRALLALADDVAERVGGPRGDELARVRRRLGPRILVLRPVRDRMLYDRTQLTAVAGHPVELVFENVDIMPHNVLVTAPGALARVGLAAEAMASDPGAWDRSFVPDLPEVLHASRLLQPGESQTLRFDAPEEPGDYPYVCTFPGHWVRMNGVLRVVEDWEALERRDAATGGTAVAAEEGRAFVRTWSADDLRPHLDEVDDADPALGRAVFEAASCLRCHAVGDEGGRTGPPLAEVVPNHDRESLLRQLLEPSETILAGYEAEVFVLEDGTIVAGRVLEEEGDVLLVQDDPFRDDLLELAVDEIAERARSSVSTMPSGLLSTFGREEVLALLAYLESL